MTSCPSQWRVFCLVVLSSVVPWHGMSLGEQRAAQSPSGEPPAKLRDKTLVAWVAPGNLVQRGGGVLTIEKPGGVFDAIVFGELAPARWMAGSNGFRRTQKEQANWYRETADAATFVQVAIVYQGTKIRILRGGELVAQYDAQSAELFGDDSVIWLGRRHLDAQPGNRFFVGAIDDARLYDVALPDDQIATLQANQPSQPPAVAWWDFEQGQATDRMGRFPVSVLLGRARLTDGKLHLDAPGDHLLAAREQPDCGLASTNVNQADQQARALRERLLSDPYRPGYHFVVPEGRAMPFDPNGAIFWKGRYHLFYIFQDHRGHNWGHVSSVDLLHWRHHPTGLVDGMFSGNCFLNKQGQPTMCYHQVGQGNALAVALDDELNTWEKLPTNPITPRTESGDPNQGRYRSWDPYGWLEGDTYYAIFGGERPAVVKSPSTAGPWQYVGDLMAHSVGDVSIHEDVSCADFFRLGDRHMLLCISHRLGCRYYLGQWKDERFYPEFHEKMSWVDNSFFAPESLLDGQGRRIMWAWIFDAPAFGTRLDFGWSGTMSLPRVLSLDEQGRLLINPPEELKRLRYHPQRVESLLVAADAESTLDAIAGHSLELELELSSQQASRYGVKVCCAPDGAEQTAIYYDATTRQLAVDTRRSSLGEGPQTVEAGPLELQPDERLKLRVFVDRSVVEVFANGRQAVMRRIYPTRRDSVQVRLFSQGGPVHVHALQAWQMAPSNAY